MKIAAPQNKSHVMQLSYYNIEKKYFAMQQKPFLIYAESA